MTLPTQNYPLPEQVRAAELLKLYGRSSNDYFKLWPDKSYWFTRSGNGFAAYGTARRVAISLGDPVAPRAEMDTAIRRYAHFCRENRWIPVFYQVTPQFLPIYRALGYRTFKGSEEAIVDVRHFSLSGKKNKQLRHTVNMMEREDVTTALFQPPVPSPIVAQAREVSDAWLAHNNRRERTFTVGRFMEEYVRHTPLMAVLDYDGHMLAFANLIPSYAFDTATIDMMRFRPDALHGTMDFLFIRLFEYARDRHFHYFSLGPAPITGEEVSATGQALATAAEEIGNDADVATSEAVSAEERAFYQLTRYLDGYFSMSGLREYKAKFATKWEPRYVIYPKRRDLPRIVQAIDALCELDENRVRRLNRDNARRVWHVSTSLIGEIRRRRLQARAAKTSA